MTKNIHTATLPDGTVAKRTSTSGRVYLFCVASRPSYELALKRAADPRYLDNTAYAHYTGIITRGGYNERQSWETAEQYAASCAKEVAEAKKAIGTAKSEAEYQAGVIAKRVADVEAKKVEGHYEAWGVHGWQSRLDLAQKVLAQVLASEWHGVAEARIIPVSMIAK